ncbi:hypothetical protein V3851_07380 [Paenibacillus sp. M1]|uniref:Uncharacterized protein n=1 Tax=Paenibacillus haidiansis TaxID=1574488 RepID=A0ABU7VPG5_9BACL
MANLLDRYTLAQREVIEAYWETIRFTRRSGKISENIKQREYEYWDKFESDVVILSLSTHIEKYPTHREDYTRGIMRNKRNQKGGAAHEGNRPIPSRPAAKGRGAASPGRDADAQEAFRRRLSGL